jgi:Asp/Glu/hydantoin racemase
MRIWAQSNTALRTEKRWADYTRAIEAHLDAVKRPDTEVRVEGVGRMEPNVIGSAFSRYLNVKQVLELGVQAEKEGYDAFVMLGLGLGGHDELRELLSIPVVYAESVAWNFAIAQHGNFALIGHEPSVYFRRAEQIRMHGFQSFFVAGDYCDIREQQVLDAFLDPAAILGELEASTRRAARDGARILIPDFNVLNDFLIAAGVRQFHGVPIMDTGGLSLKTAEFLVDARASGVLPSSRSKLA